jgi:hypothetical protein
MHEHLLKIINKYDSKFVLNPERPVLKFVFAFDSRGDTIIKLFQRPPPSTAL